MPVSFLSPAQRDSYGQYLGDPSTQELARYFHLDDSDHTQIVEKRGDANRLGFALQLTTVRFVGTFLDDPTAVPPAVLATMSRQLGIDTTTDLTGYRDGKWRFAHAAQIRTEHGYRDLADRAAGFGLTRWLYAQCWTGTERPSALFDRATTWMLAHKVLLPGATTLERFVAKLRHRVDVRVWRVLASGISPPQQRRLEDLLRVPDGGRSSSLVTLRTGAAMVSGPALVRALERLNAVRSLSITVPAAAAIAPTRIAALARFAEKAKVTAVARLPALRRTATLVAFVHSLEASAQDDALEVLDRLLRDIFGAAEKADRKARLRSLKDLDALALTLAHACAALLDPALPDNVLRDHVFARVPRATLAEALGTLSTLVRPPDDVFYTELQTRYRRVRLFLPTLLHQVHFEAAPAGAAVVAALEYLKRREAPARAQDVAPSAVVTTAWRRYVYGANDAVDHRAYTFCVLDQLREALRRRDVFVTPSWRYADPRRNLLAGAEWEAARPSMCRTLGYSPRPDVSERAARVTDLGVSVCAVLLAEACNTGLEPLVRHETQSLRRDRLSWVSQNYLRDETLRAANARLVAAQTGIPLARAWGGGEVASADGLRFVVPVRTVHAGPNPKYFGIGRGVTYYNLVSDQFTGLHGITVPGTLRDSLVLLAVALEQQTELQPTQIMTDTGAYSDVVFGLFRLLGYRFSPRLADIGGTRFWRIDSRADYGPLNRVARQSVNLDRITPQWDDMLRTVGSLKLGRVPATGIMRTLQVGDRPTRLAQAFAEFGRIDKTIHTLTYLDDEAKRRATLIQLNRGEGRHALARAVFHGKRGELRQRYREGQENQLDALGVVVNMIVLWNTIYMQAALDLHRADGHSVRPEDEARLSPLGHEHINLLGRYSFAVPESVARGELRPLRNPADGGR